MNQDLFPTDLSELITPRHAFELAELVALRYRDNIATNPQAQQAAYTIASQIAELAELWLNR